MIKNLRRLRWAICALILLELAIAASLSGSAYAANGSIVYTYDALGRVLTANYDTGVIVIYTYDSNGNRTAQVINVNTKPLCLGTSAHGNPTTFGVGLLSPAASGC